MNLTVRPTKNLSRLFSDWLRPDGIFDRDSFDLESNFIPLRIGINVPSVNLKETSEGYTFEVAAPGLERKDFNIEIESNVLKISADKERKLEEEKKSNGYSRKEYSYNSFSRSFTLPKNIKEVDIDAKYENGILMVHVPKEKIELAKPVQKITVK